MDNGWKKSPTDDISSWHDITKEKPEDNRAILAMDSGFMIWAGAFYNGQFCVASSEDMEWPFAEIEIFLWKYVDELLPKKITKVQEDSIYWNE